jgi:hypothetical protein
MGCHADAPKTTAADPKASTSLEPTNDNPDPTNKDCAAISDPAKAEDCRLWKGVAEAKKKHNSNNVVKHSPGSIQQP